MMFRLQPILVGVASLLVACSQAQLPAPAATAPRASSGSTFIWTFDEDAAGALPTGATAFSGMWGVRADSEAASPPNDLCQTGSADFAALQLINTQFTDVILSARINPVSGKTAQAAGLLFRIQDKNNYYVLRASVLEGTVVLDKVVQGQHNVIQDVKAEVKAGQWQSLRAEVRGNRVRGVFEGQSVVDATDDSFKSGAVGLWTQADSLACFDNVQATAR